MDILQQNTTSTGTGASAGPTRFRDNGEAPNVDIQKNLVRDIENGESNQSVSGGSLDDDTEEQKGLSSGFQGADKDDRKVDENTKALNSLSAALSMEGEAPSRREGVLQVVQPHSLLPRPEAPPAVTNRMEVTQGEKIQVPDIAKFIKEKSHSLSEAITKRLSSLKERNTGEDDRESNGAVTQISLSGVKVIVNYHMKKVVPELQGRVTFFSRSNCRDCSAVRSFLRDRKLNYVEINVDVFPKREKELIELTGSSTVPQIYFNDKLIGGLVALNSLRNSGMIERKLKEMLSMKCPASAPAPPVYGFDDDEDSDDDPAVRVVWVLRQKLPIRDRLVKMKLVKNGFCGSDLVQVIMQHFDCGRRKAVELGEQLARKHFIHHVSG